MRAILAIILFLALPVQAQIVGMIECANTGVGAKLLSAKVSFMEDKDDYSVRTLGLNDLHSQIITFKKAAVATVLTGMRMTCEFFVPGWKSLETRSTAQWLEPIPIAAGVEPKLVVNLVETSPGLWRAFIGKAP